MRLVDHGVSTDEVVEGRVVVAKVRVVVSMVGVVVAMGEGIVLEVEVPLETWWTVLDAFISVRNT